MKNFAFEKRNRVGSSSKILMLGTAIFFDVLQGLFSLIPFLGWILGFLISIFAFLTFFVWMKIKGWGLSDNVKKIFVQWFLPIGELIPIVNILPIWTTRVILQLLFIEMEDAIYNKTSGLVDLEKLTTFNNTKE